MSVAKKSVPHSAVAPLLPQAQGADVYPPAIRLKPARRQVQPGEIVAPVVEQGGKEFSQFLPPLSILALDLRAKLAASASGRLSSPDTSPANDSCLG